MTALVLTAFLGIPLMILGWWWPRRARRNLATIEATYATYIGQVADSLAPAGVAPMRTVGLVLLALLAHAGAAAAQDLTAASTGARAASTFSSGNTRGQAAGKLIDGIVKKK
jgi:hypothetical protein